jgi:cytochrome c oxidase assembly protein subunit 15
MSLDFSWPLVAQLVTQGLIVALLPLSLVWVATDANKFRKLTSITLFLTFDLIVFGAFTRLTDSGLGCPDWPGCYGKANPLLARLDINVAQTALPSGPVTVMKAWIEMIHRYLAMSVGILIVVLMIVAWRRWWHMRQQARSTHSGETAQNFLARYSPWLPTFLFGFVCLQGAFGAWTVTLKLQPIIVTTHLMLGLGLLGLLTLLKERQTEFSATLLTAQSASVSTSSIRNFRTLPVSRLLPLLALILLAMQIVLGGWVSTNYAAMACTDFPLCHGQVIPQMDFSHGFTLWRQLGMTAAGDYLPFSALTAIHWAHRNFAFVVLTLVIWVALRALKIPLTRQTAKWVIALIALQFLSGVLNVYLQWPLALAVLHSAGAAALVVLMVMLNFRTFIAAKLHAERLDQSTGRTLLQP